VTGTTQKRGGEGINRGVGKVRPTLVTTVKLHRQEALQTRKSLFNTRTPPTSASTTPICSGNQFVHLGKIAGITCDRSLGQKLSIAAQMSGLCLVGMRSPASRFVKKIS
jgi:hypothetical protein